jgi:hypothetical protein
MTLIRHVGPVASIAPGATHSWEFWFGDGAEVGVALVTPNLLLSQINTELVMIELGVLTVDSGGKGGPLTRYTVRVRNNGATWMDYDLNIGNLLRSHYTA